VSDRHRGNWTRCRSTCGVAALLVVSLAVAGCLGPKAIQYTRLRYNDVIRDTNDQQLLLNIVRLRYADSPVFIDLPNITSQFELSGGGNYFGGYGNQVNAPASLGTGQLSVRDTPTLSYHPREGREIAKALLTPLTADLFSIFRSGADVEQLFLLTLQEINDVPNAVQAVNLTPSEPDDNTDFMRGIRLLSALRRRQATELVIGIHEETDDFSDPIPQSSIFGRDVVEAAKDGNRFKAEANGKMRLVKRQRELFLRIQEEYARSPEMLEVEKIFRLTPGLKRYRIKSELSEDANHEKEDNNPNRLPDPLIQHDTIFLNLRSVLQIMTFLSKGVCVPEEHEATGEVPTTPGPDGRPFNWTAVTAGHFVVHAQKHKPRDAEVAIPYRGYWFFIAKDDVKSRAVLAILEILFALQESADKSAGPILTLPLGG
jgi:hypothetical protein